MTLVVLIPVKPPAEGKSRLRGLLSETARAELVWTLLDRVLDVATRHRGAAASLVISRDPAVLERAAARGAGTVHEREEGDLNAALDLGRSEALGRGADAILVLPGDLPLLAAADIDALIAAAARPPAVAIAPDRREQGTNALLLSPPGILSFAFGEESFAAHVAAARRCGMEPAIVRRPGLAFDVDTPDDYARLRQREDSPAIG